MHEPLSIVIPSARRADLLRPCLEAVRAHAPPGTEVLVVDDGSPNASVSQVARSQGVAVLRRPRPGGFCVAANAGIHAAGGAIVELLNDDTRVEPGWAEAALACFAADEVAAVAPLVLDATGQRIDSAGQRYYLGGVAGKRGHGQALAPEYLTACRVFGACASSAFYRREVLLAVGGFPASFGAYFDDVDLSFRLNRAGYQVRFEPASRVRHHGGASHPPSRRLAEQQARNEERVFWRNLPADALARASWRHAAVLAGKAYRRWQEGALTPFVCGRLRVLGEIGAIRRQRRALLGLGDGHVPQDWMIEDRFWE
jgi:GT2 family glycosyltransferase